MYIYVILYRISYIKFKHYILFVLLLGGFDQQFYILILYLWY